MKKMTLPSISSKSTSHLSTPWLEELVNDLMDQAVSLLVCKYKFERNLNKRLGLISFPITETLLDLLLGFKKVKGSHICLSSEVNWNCLLQKLEEAQWARQISLQASKHGVPQHSTSQHTVSHQDTSNQDTSQHSTEAPSMSSTPAIVTDQKVAEEPSLHSELPGPELPTPQEKSTAEEQEPVNVLEPTLSTCYSTDGSHQSEQAVDVGESQSIEDAEEDDKDQSEDKDYESLGG